jgi:hypothetical protein
MDEHFPTGHTHEGGSVRDRMWLVRAKENITIAPRCQQVMLAKLEYKKERERPSLVCIEPAQFPIEGIFPARAIARVGSNVLESPHATQRADRVETRHSNGRVHVLLANFTKETLTIPKATVLGIAEEVSEQLVDKINPGNNTDLQAPHRPPRQNEKVLYDKLLQGKLDHLKQEDRLHIKPLLRKFAHIFHDEDTNDFTGNNVVEHQIGVGDALHIRRPQYRTPYALRGEMQAQVQNMLDKGIIRESSSPWSAAAIPVPKKSPDGKQNYGFCVDFRALNSVSKFDSYPMPVMV